MKYKGGIISLAVLLTIGLCSFTGAETTTETYSDYEIQTYADEYPIATGYSHKWNGNKSTSGGDFPASDFSSNVLNPGSTTINGLNWSYTSAVYFSQDGSKGLHIGSGSVGQTEDPFVLTANFGETVVLTSISVTFSNASKGGYSNEIYVTNGATKTTIQTIKDANTENTTYEYEDLYYECDSLSISLLSTVTKTAIYFYSISFELLIKEDSNIQFTPDTYDGDAAVPGVGDCPKTNYSAIDDNYESYYANTDLTKTGDDLRDELYSLTSKMTKISYGDIRYTSLYTDADIDEPKYLYGIYDGDLIPAVWDSGNSWQREHIWPCARMGAGGDGRPTNSTKAYTSDLHNLRVCCNKVNNDKSDKWYDNTTTSTAFYANVEEGFYGAGHAYTGDHRGDTARTLFYMYVRYNAEEGITFTNLESDMETNNRTLGIEDVLIEWALEDEPDEFEIQRNNRIYEYQGNRNPFIDYPELVSQLFELDSGEDLDPITINVDSSYSVTEGQTINLNVTTDPSNANITYTSSDTSVATVSSSGVVTGVKAGTVTITITASLDGYQTTSVTTSVTVNEMPSVSFTLDFSEFTVMEEHSQIVELESVTPNNATMTLESSNTSVFTVSKDSDWYIYGVAPGSATLYVTVSADGYKSVTESVPVTITEMPTASVTFDKTSYTIEEGEREDIGFTSSYKNVTVSFTSSNPSVAEVLYDTDYYIQTYQPGTVTITATINASDCHTGTQTLEVTVTSHPTISVTFAQSSYSINNGESVYVSLTTDPNDASIELAYDDTGIEVTEENDAYKVTGLVPGTYPLTATASKDKYYSGRATTYINVIDTSLSEITINWDASSYTLDEGDEITFNVSTEPRDGVTLIVTSEDEEIAKVSDNNDGSYTLSGLTPGTTNIYALAYAEGFNNAVKVVSVIVNEIVTPEPEEGTITLSFNRDSYITKVGDRLMVSTIVDPSEAIVTYSIKDTSIASLTLLEDGNWAVIGLKEGTTTLTATASLDGYESVSVSITLTVEASDLPIEPEVTEPGPEEENQGLSNGAIAAIIIAAAVVILAVVLIPVIVHHRHKKKAL